jgi:hypothetical protein
MSEASENAGQEPAPSVVVPDDFPRDPYPSGLAGAQPKFSARLIDGRYVVGLTEEERQERYLFCAGWVEQLVGYVAKVQTKKPEMTMEDVMQYVHAGIRRERGDLGEVELDWIMAKLRTKVLPPE